MQVQMVCLDELVPADDDLRRIERLVSWPAVRAAAAPFYVSGGPGRPALDPVVLVKLALVLAWRGGDSMREVLRTSRTDLSVRLFLGFGLTEQLPHHSTFRGRLAISAWLGGSFGGRVEVSRCDR